MRARALLLALTLGLPASAQDRCILACDVVTEGSDATARIESVLGIAMPPGAEVVGLVEVGFQDAFAQARFQADGPALDALLAAIGAKRGDLILRDDPYAGPYAGVDSPLVGRHRNAQDPGRRGRPARLCLRDYPRPTSARGAREVDSLFLGRPDLSPRLAPGHPRP